jgi:uncharacterized protein (TIGR00369 family)
MKLTELGEGTARLEMRVGRKYYNPMRSVHGGIMTDLADACMGIAVISTLEKNETFTTLELKMNFLRPVFGGRLIATSKILHRGRTIALAEATLMDSRGKLVAKGVSTCMILKGDESRNRSRANASRH